MEAAQDECPLLRPLETVVVPDARFGKALMLRDPSGFTEDVALIPAPLVPILARFDGRHTVDEIAGGIRIDGGSARALVERIVADLEGALLLDSPRFRAKKERIVGEFAAEDVRAAAHAGGAYPKDATKLRRFIREACTGAGRPGRSGLRGLIAPHIDPWRGKAGYGHAYAMLEDGLSREVDTFILLGTSHAPMRQPFALCRKPFQTPLGTVEADTEAIDAVAQACSFDPYADLYNHKREHSVEFQAVFVRAVTGKRKIKIVPVLCGGERRRGGAAEGFVRVLAEVYRARLERTVVVAGADLAHVGPRFGDAAPYDENERRGLEQKDRASLALAASLDAPGFFDHVAADLEVRRVCGLAPIFTLLKLLPEDTLGTVAHYEQTVDPKEGSIVSHAAVGFYVTGCSRPDRG